MQAPHSSIAPLVEWLRSARSAVAFTGAGISTESGIPDFRSPGGVWSKYAPIYYDEFVASRQARVRYWRQRVVMYNEFARARPNDGHKALARLEEQGRLVAVITQNIDGLHQLAGSRRVVELHGTVRTVACICCGREWPPEEIHVRVEGGDDAPACDDCGSPLKSKTVSFGQAMPEREMQEAAELVRASDVCVAIGSSLVVEPAASIPRLAKKTGARLVILNNAATPLDPIADSVIRAAIGETLVAVLEHVGRESPPANDA